jgi:hypothetical protein
MKPRGFLASPAIGVLTGVVMGLLGTCVGLSILTVWWCTVNDMPYRFFVEDVFLRGQLYQDSILTLSILFNVLVFYILLRFNRLQWARGVLLVVLISVPVVVWLQFKNLGS